MSTVKAFDWKTLPVVTLAAFLLGACGGAEQQTEVAQPEPEPAAEVTPQPPPEPSPPPTPPPAPEPEQQTAEASYWEDTNWAPGSEGNLVMGLNGGEYEPYKPSLIRDLQSFLFEQGFYEGPVTGVLDLETMKATARFQEERGIEQSGIPTPRTREAMQSASSDET